MLLAVVSSKAYYGINKTFCGLMFFFAGLYQPGGPNFIRWQLAITYFGAGLNKLLDPDWHSEQEASDALPEREPNNPIYMIFDLLYLAHRDLLEAFLDAWLASQDPPRDPAPSRSAPSICGTRRRTARSSARALFRSLRDRRRTSTRPGR